MFKNVEGWKWLPKEDAFLQPLFKCISRSGILIILRGIKRFILPQFKSNHIIRALPIVELPLLRGNNVIRGTDD